MTVAMADKILISILCLSGLAVAQSVDVIGNCSVSSPPEPFVVTGPRPSLLCELLGTSSCSNGDLPSSVGGPFMGPPASMQLESILYPWGSKLWPQLEVTWEPPKSAAGINQLKGFYMKFYKIKGSSNQVPDTFCRVFDFSQNNFTEDDHKLKFTKTFVQLIGGAEYLYMLDLYTLPYSSESEKLRQVFTLQAEQSENNTGDWRAAMSVSIQNISAPAQVEVQFSLAPTRFNFKKYRLYLVDIRDQNNALVLCEVSVEDFYECQGKMNPPPDSRTVTHTFLDVPAGTYSVWVQPKDPHWQDDTNCLCYQEHSGGKTCVTCMTTMLNESIVVEGAIPTPETSTSTPTQPQPVTSTEADNKPPSVGGVEQNNPSTDNSTMVVVAAVLGTVIGLALVSLAGFCFWRQRRGGGVKITLPFTRQNNKPNTQVVLPKKKICVVYTFDHEDHFKVIDKLARYLDNQCACKVFFMPWYQAETRTMGCYEWILHHINISDYVLIINSEAAFNLYSARNNNTSFRREDKGPEEDMFSVAMSHVMAGRHQLDFYKKNILTYFEYTKEDFLLKDFGPGIQYKLIKHLKELLCHIHEVETYGLDSRHFTIDGFADVQSKPEGRDLIEAITKAKHFQKTNPYWFHKHFHRQDSAYESASPDPDEEPDSVSTGGRFQFPNDDESRSTVTCNTNYLKQHQQDLEAMSAVTYNTQYQNNHPRFFPLAPSTVATTTAPTEVIDDQLAHINRQGMSNPAFNCDTHLGESSSDYFFPPSEVRDDDIDEQLMKINRESSASFQDLTPTYEHLDPASTNMDQTYEHYNPARSENQAGHENTPSTMCEDNDSDISDGRDV